jgi:hypothetical protein
MNIDKKYIEQNGQLLIFVTGLSGSQQNFFASELGKNFDLNVIQLKNYQNKENKDNIIDFNKLNEDIDEKKKTGLIVSGFPVSISKLNHKIDIYITLSINKTKYVEYKKLQNKNNNNNDRSISRLEEDIINHYYKTIEIYTTIMEPIKVDKFINLNKYENNEEIYSEIFNTIVNIINKNIYKKNN